MTAVPQIANIGLASVDIGQIRGTSIECIKHTDGGTFLIKSYRVYLHMGPEPHKVLCANAVTLIQADDIIHGVDAFLSDRKLSALQAVFSAALRSEATTIVSVVNGEWMRRPHDAE